MISILMVILSVVAAYIIGSFPTSFIMAKVVKGFDIRDVGSKNAGATNVLRTVGKVPAVITLVIDILKGVFVVTVVASFSYNYTQGIDWDFYRAFLGLVAVCGHIWPVFLNFRGGKGVATTIGVAMAIAPLVFLPSLAIWVMVFSLTKYVSLASILALISFPVIAAVFNCPVYTILISIVICLISIYRHKDNIKRLLKGEENKTILGKPR